MKKNVSKLLFAGLAISFCNYTALAQLGGIKDKMKNAVSGIPVCDNVKSDNGVSGPLHTKYMNKIVFSKSEIVKGQENEAAFVNSFNASDNFYQRVYLEKSMANSAKEVGECYNASSSIEYRWTFDDGATKVDENTDIYNFLSGGGNESYDMWTTFQPGMKPANQAKEEYPQGDVRRFAVYLSQLSNGTHKVKCEIILHVSNENAIKKYGKERVLASGEFTVNISEEGKKAAAKGNCASYQKYIDDYNSPEFTLVPTAASVVKATKTIDWTKFTLLKIVGDDDWTYVKNVYGIVTGRKAYASAYLLYEDGFVRKSELSFYQDNISSGGDKYGKTSQTVEEQNIEFVKANPLFYKECVGAK